MELLKTSQQQFLGTGFNLSDLKADKTIYFESPQNSNSRNQRSPFEPSEISARSTLHKNVPNNRYVNDMDFDEIMRTSVSSDVRSKYRESIGMGRLSFLPRTADMSLRTSIASSCNQKTSDDFWDAAKISTNSFNGRNMSVSSECFRPAEEMVEQLKVDEIEQEQEFATIPNIQPVTDQTTWEERASRQPEMSFGAYCQDFLPVKIRDVYNNKSPAKRNNRVAMVDVTNDDDSSNEGSRIGAAHIQKLISELTRICF